MTQDLLPPLQHPVARVLLAGFVLLHVVLGLASTGPTPVTLSALVLVCGAAAVAVLPQRLPRRRLAVAVLGPLAASGLVLSTLHVQGWPGYAAWPFGATTFIAVALAVRGRRGAAWLLLTGLAAESVAWSLLEGVGPLPGLDLVVRHVGTLLLGTLFAIGLQRSTAAVAAFHRAELARRVERAGAEAAEHERRRSIAHLLDLSSSALEAVAAGEQVDAGSLRALEGRLRDEMLALPLLTEQVNRALADARERGVDVVLLGDPRAGGLSQSDLDRATDWLAARVGSARSGGLIARATVAATTVRLSAQLDGDVEVVEFDRAVQ